MSRSIRETCQAAARAIGQQILIVGASRERGFDAAFAELAKQKAGALFVSPDAFFQSRRVEIVILAARHAIPAISSTREFAESGGLISYGASQIWAAEQAACIWGGFSRARNPVTCRSSSQRSSSWL